MTDNGFWTGTGWAVVAGLASLAFLALVVVLLASLIRSRPGAGITATSSAIRVLEERYASGEISRDEFLERRAVLSGLPKDPPGGINR